MFESYFISELKLREVEVIAFNGGAIKKTERYKTFVGLRKGRVWSYLQNRKNTNKGNLGKKKLHSRENQEE